MAVGPFRSEDVGLISACAGCGREIVRLRRDLTTGEWLIGQIIAPAMVASAEVKS